ncbi:MAG: transcriptional regulator, CadC [Acidobacteriaceae bacterium]|nr:transcriptional regulator, CadC [Acidobacteriaceae bacterium]
MSREELQRRVWGTNVEVDLDHSLKTAINKIREALKDSPDNPRFIETLPRRGYRFIAPVTTMEEVERSFSELPVVVSHLPEITAKDTVPAGRPISGAETILQVKSQPRLWPWICGIALFVAGLVSFTATRPTGNIPLYVAQVTTSGRIMPGTPHTENLASFATDGLRLYLSEITGGMPALAEVSISDGEVGPLSVPPEVRNPVVDDLSSNGSKLLVHNHLGPEIEQSLWIVPTHGGTAKRIPNIVVHASAWMPNGKQILYATGSKLFVANEDGSEIREFASVPGRAFWLRWSPSGDELRFTILDSQRHTSTLWTLKANILIARPLLSDWSTPASECCGSWTADGRYFVFQSSHNGTSNLWKIAQHKSILRSNEPIQITNGPSSYQAPVPDRSGHKIFFVETEPRYAQLRYDTGQKRFSPSPVTMTGTDRTEFSHDGQWVAWIRNTDGSLWRGRTDGSYRIQISSPPTRVWLMHWSPDGKRLTYMGRLPGQPWKLFVADNSGNDTKMLLKEDRNEADPDWSPDGSQIIFGRLPNIMANETAEKDIEIVNVQDGSVHKLPGSEGFYAPRWSPDGKYIAAMPMDQHRLMIFDTTSRTWRILVDRELANPTWSSDSRSIFFQVFAEEDQPIYRVWLGDGHIERIVGMNDMPTAGTIDFSFSSLAPGDVPLIRARTWTANIYAIDLNQ